MLEAPDVDLGLLAATLTGEFELSARTLRFIPAGETSWCFEAIDHGGGRWFAKLVPPDAIEPARAELALRLGGTLADLGLPVPRPLRTRSGALSGRVEGLRVAVFKFIDGQPLSDRDLAVAGTIDQVARLVAAIHAATPVVTVPVPTEGFVVWAGGLHHCLAELEPDPEGSALRAEARRLIRPQRAALLGMLEHLQALGKAVSARRYELVLCHGDLIGDNLLRDRAGQLCAVDWDRAVRAPRELDLALFAGPGFQRFLDSYRLAAGDSELPVDPDLIGFFLLRRNLDDLVDWLPARLTSTCPMPSGTRTSTACDGACHAGTSSRRGSTTSIRWPGSSLADSTDPTADQAGVIR
jgi:Ser/Thr protein kinase RdoA (MazF antagonist)